MRPRPSRAALLAGGALALLGCGKRAARPGAGADAGVARAPVALVDAAVARRPIEKPEAPPYGDDIKSVRLKRSIVVRVEPNPEAKARGTVAQDTRVPVLAWAHGKGCKGWWIEIQDGGWVCDRYLEASKKAPTGVELPKLKDGELVPGVYGVLREPTDAYKTPADVLALKPTRTLAGSVKLRRVDEVEVDNKLYWKITSGELVQASKIAPLHPTEFAGVELGDGPGKALPLAWIAPRTNKKGSVGGHPFRSVVPVLEEDAARARVRVAAKAWLPAADLRIARLAPPPPGLLPGEKWIDVDTAQQTLVAYEGERPVFATLVSTGQKKWPTRPGVYRIYVKFAETDMNGQMGDEEPYSVATVPWTQYFAGDLALHTAYWHDRFGEARSHGCVNLTPKDARFLYRWSDPGVLPGYSMAHGILQYPGSIVRIRSSAAPEVVPEVQGYAKRVLAARSGGGTGSGTGTGTGTGTGDEADPVQVDRSVTPTGN